MGRKTKQGLNTSPIEYAMYDDRKIQKAMEIIDPDNTGLMLKYFVPHIAVRMFCEIYLAGYFIEWNEDICFDLSKKPGFIGFVNSITLSKIVNALIESGIFHKGIFKKHSLLTSNGIQKRWLYVTKSLDRKDCSIRKELMLITKPEKNNPPGKSLFPPREIPVSPPNEAISFPLPNIGNSIVGNDGKDNNQDKIVIPDDVDEIGITWGGNGITGGGNGITWGGNGITGGGNGITGGGNGITGGGNNEAEIQTKLMERFFEVNEFLEVYFKGAKYAHGRETLCMAKHMDLDTLIEWAKVFNKHLVITAAGLTDDGKTVKTEKDWITHFTYWLNKIDLNKNPNTFFDNNNSSKNGKHTSNNGQPKILNEAAKRDLLERLRQNSSGG